MKPLNWTTKLLNWTILKLIYWTLKLNNSIKSVFNFFTSSLWRLDLSFFLGGGGFCWQDPYSPSSVHQLFLSICSYFFSTVLASILLLETVGVGLELSWKWYWTLSKLGKFIGSKICLLPSLLFFLSSLIKRYIFVVRTSSFNIFSIFIHFISVWK